MKRIKIIAFIFFCVSLCIGMTQVARADDGISVPEEYRDFIDSADGEVADKLPHGALESDIEDLHGAAQELSSAKAILSVLISAVSDGLLDVAPRLALILAIVIISALCYSVSSYCSGGLSRAVDVCVRLCSLCALSGVALSSAESVKLYFERLFSAVAAFIPLGGVMYAMGGSLTSAASSTATLTVTLAVCEFICGYTVIPVFCICLCTSMMGAFGGSSAFLGGTLGASVRKWYTTAMAFVMMILK